MIEFWLNFQLEDICQSFKRPIFKSEFSKLTQPLIVINPIMTRKSDNERAFYVVQFIELPFEGIDDYVCVPYTWLIMHQVTEQRAVVAYPKDEDPFDTRDRAKRKERYNDAWGFYMAAVKRGSDSYNDAEFWIATRNDYGPLVEKESEVTEIQPKLPVNKKLRSAKQNHMSKSNDNFRKPLPRISIKRPAQSELKAELDAKRLKLEEAAHSSNAVVDDVQESRITVAPPKETFRDNQETLTDDFSNNNPQSHQLLNSLKMSANLYCKLSGARCLVPTQRTVEKSIQPMKIERTVATTSQNLSNLMDRTIPSSTSSVQQLPVVTQNQIRDGVRDQIFKRLQQKQLQPTQRDSQRQLQKPKIRIGITMKPKNNRPTPLQRVTKKTLSPILTKVLNSVRQALSTTHDTYLQNNQQREASPNGSVLVDRTHQNVIGDACQPDECMIDESLSPYHAVTSDSDSVTDQEEISDHEMSTDESPVKTTNNVHNTTNDSNCGSADKPTVAQNSTTKSHQMNRKVVLEQQMLDNFASLFMQMGSTLRHTTDMYNTLRSSILETAVTYKKLLGAVEQFNTAGHAATIASPSSKLRPESPRSPEARHTKVTASASSSNQDQHTNDGADKTPENKHNKLYRFVLPPEYDAYDTRWTLKYQTNLPGLVELMPQSGVYVSKGDLLYCQQVSKDCKSLAQRLLPQVFSRNALSICLSMSEKAQAANNVGSSIRPDLDDHACSVLLNFVIEHGLQRGWNTDLEPILSILHIFRALEKRVVQMSAIIISE
nr:BEN [Cotesia vestalis bracovirus]